MFVAVLHDEHDIIERYLLLCVCCAWLQSTAVSKMEERWKVMYRDVSWWIVMLRERHQHEIIISFRSFPFVPAHFHLSFSSTSCPLSPWLTDLWISQQTLSSTTPLHSTHHLIVHSRSHSLIASFIHSFIHTVVICLFSMFSSMICSCICTFIHLLCDEMDTHSIIQSSRWLIHIHLFNLTPLNTIMYHDASLCIV